MIGLGMETFKDIMVHVECGEADAERLALASALAERFESHLTALPVNDLPG